jgi:hypothetical protein
MGIGLVYFSSSTNELLRYPIYSYSRRFSDLSTLCVLREPSSPSRAFPLESSSSSAVTASLYQRSLVNVTRPNTLTTYSALTHAVSKIFRWYDTRYSARAIIRISPPYHIIHKYCVQSVEARSNAPHILQKVASLIRCKM